VIAPAIDAAAEVGVGATVLGGVQATRAAIGARNTNLGILLLLAPLAASATDSPRADALAATLAQLDEADAHNVYAAIRLVQPGGLGRAQRGDVNDAQASPIPLLEAMQLAADRDLVARQYINGYREVFATAARIQRHAEGRPLGEAIVRSYLELIRDCPDSLIARKCGSEMAQAVSSRVGAVLESAALGDGQFDMMLADLDFWLRSDGNRLNPGTSADIVAASLFVLLVERRVDWPVAFY
jgi:triphosphoribosyl-dephospho-CoA synthase